MNMYNCTCKARECPCVHIGFGKIHVGNTLILQVYKINFSQDLDTLYENNDNFRDPK